MKYRLLIQISLVCLNGLFCNYLYGQNENKSEEKICRLPELGLNYHLQISHADFLPVLNYKFNRYLDAGVGGQYVYYFRSTQRDGKSSYGFNVYSRIYPVKSLFVHAEYLYSNVPYINKRIYEFERVYVSNFLGGIGFRQPITDRVDTYFTGLFDFTHSENSVYGSKILFRIGVTF
jgi:hypothetical protein